MRNQVSGSIALDVSGLAASVTSALLAELAPALSEIRAAVTGDAPRIVTVPLDYSEAMNALAAAFGHTLPAAEYERALLALGDLGYALTRVTPSLATHRAPEATTVDLSRTDLSRTDLSRSLSYPPDVYPGWTGQGDEEARS